MPSVITISPAALASAAESERLGQPHPALRASAVYVPTDESSRHSKGVNEELKQSGLLDGDGRVIVSFAELLPPLCKPAVEYVAYFSFDGRVRRALSVAVGGMGIAAVRDGETIMMREIGEDELVDALLGELPELTPGSGPLVSVNLDLVRSARGEALPRQVDENVRALRSVTERPVTETMEIGVGVRDDKGAMAQARSQLHIALTDWGHFVTYTLGSGREEEAWGGPATYDNVRRALGQLRADVERAGAVV